MDKSYLNLIDQIDYSLFVIINGFAGQWPWLDNLARLCMNDYLVPTVMALALLALWFDGATPAAHRRNRQAVLTASLSAAVANTLLKLINLLVQRPRPFDAHAVNLLFYQPTDPSLPSNAATLGFSIATGVWLYRRRWGGVLLGVALLFGLSRIFGGVHYPLDVLAGALLGHAATTMIRRQTTVVNRLLNVTLKLTQKLGLP